MKNKIGFLIVTFIIGIFLMGSTTMDVPYPIEIRPDSGLIIFTHRVHDTLQLDTIAIIDTNGIWHKYGDFDSLATPRAKIDTSWIDIDFNDKDITGVNKITADSGNIAEMWIEEERADTFSNVFLMANAFGSGYTSNQTANYPTYINNFMVFNSDDDYIGWNFGNLISCDSAIINSVVFKIEWITSEYDTVLIGYFNQPGVGATGKNFTEIETDTISYTSNAHRTHTYIYNKSYTSKKPFNGILLYGLDISNTITTEGLILNYTAYNKRYGQP